VTTEHLQFGKSGQRSVPRSRQLGRAQLEVVVVSWSKRRVGAAVHEGGVGREGVVQRLARDAQTPRYGGARHAGVDLRLGGGHLLGAEPA
jgi:hypothetical protein